MPRDRLLNVCSYIQTSVEEFSRTNSESFDAVVISNVLEYDINFWNKRDFLKCCVNCCKVKTFLVVENCGVNVSDALSFISQVEIFLSLPWIPQSNPLYGLYISIVSLFGMQ